MKTKTNLISFGFTSSIAATYFCHRRTRRSRWKSVVPALIRNKTQHWKSSKVLFQHFHPEEKRTIPPRKPSPVVLQSTDRARWQTAANKPQSKPEVLTSMI